VSLTESPVEEAALGWIGGLGRAVVRGPHLALGGPAAVRDPFGEGVLVGCLRGPIRRLNLEIGSYNLATLCDTRLPNRLSGEGSVPTAEEMVASS
jgi:hypothetical protein